MLCNPFICLSVCLSVCFMSLGKNDGHRKGPKRLYLPKFMSLITFKWRQIELWSLLNRLGVLETWVLVSRRLETRFYKFWSRVLALNLGVLSWTSESWSWSCSWNPRVSVSVWSWDLGPWRLRPLGWSGTQWHVQIAASIARKSLLSVCHLCSCGKDI